MTCIASDLPIQAMDTDGQISRPEWPERAGTLACIGTLPSGPVHSNVTAPQGQTI